MGGGDKEKCTALRKTPSLLYNNPKKVANHSCSFIHSLEIHEQGSRKARTLSLTISYIMSGMFIPASHFAKCSTSFFLIILNHHPLKQILLLLPILQKRKLRY